MATGNITVTIRVNVKLAVAYVRLLKFLAPVIGPERALRWASRGALRLVLMKIDRGPWRFFDRSWP